MINGGFMISDDKYERDSDLEYYQKVNTQDSTTAYKRVMTSLLRQCHSAMLGIGNVISWESPLEERKLTLDIDAAPPRSSQEELEEDGDSVATRIRNSST